MQAIYLDHNATTPIRPEVVEAMNWCFGEVVANPASQHRLGQQARRRLEDAREQIAQLLGVDTSAARRDRVVFTSGGTEANNLALLGIARGLARGTGGPGQIIISSGEHQSVIEPAEHLLEQGWRLDTLGMTHEGVVRVDQLTQWLAERADPCLVSVQLANHETGVLQPVPEIAKLCRSAGVFLHTDAVQVVGKAPVRFDALGVAALSITAHKFRGPVGIGALVLRSDVPVEPLMFGGHQQAGVRPGTESVPLAVGMAKALELWHNEQEEYARRLRTLRDRFERGLCEKLSEVVIHGRTTGSGTDPRLPQTSNVAFPGLDGQAFLMALDMAGVACSLGSACSSGSAELSPTLRAMGLPNELVTSSLRFSLGATTTEADIDEAVRRIVRVWRQLRET